MRAEFDLPSQQIGIMPLLVVLHGHGGAGVGTITLTHMNDLADQDGFLAVYPDGLSKGWADGRGASESDQQGTDDVAYISQLITTLQGQFTLDVRRVYVAGISNGGFMAQRLGCELGNKIAAVVSVVATLSTNQAVTCAPIRPMPILYVLGESDPLVPFNGGTVNGDRGIVLSATESLAAWAKLDGCMGTPTTRTLPDRVQDGAHVSQTLYTNCKAARRLAYFASRGRPHLAERRAVSAGGGHWPHDPSDRQRRPLGVPEPVPDALRFHSASPDAHPRLRPTIRISAVANATAVRSALPAASVNPSGAMMDWLRSACHVSKPIRPR